MSYYYKYYFTSPESIYATIKEELKSYFDTGAIDDLLFPTYLDKCLKKLGRSSYVIAEDIMYLEDFQSRLPDNFYAIREAWLCTESFGAPYPSSSSFYSQALSTTIQIAPVTEGGSESGYIDCGGPVECSLESLGAVYKTNYQIGRSYKKQYLLKPGNISAKKNCDVSYIDQWDSASRGGQLKGSSSYDSFDIRDNKFVTNFRTGTVYLIFYATDSDEIGNQMVPDNYRIKEYIEMFIKYKMFETLTNQCNDETFNQLERKRVYYEAKSDEAFIMADIEIKKQTVFQKQMAIKRQLHSLDMYELPNRTNRYGRRRNS